MKRMVAALVRPAALAGLAALMVVGVACSSDEGGDSGGSAAGSSAVGTVDASGAITVVMKDNLYEPKGISGPANQPITVTLDNKGAAIHNLAIKGQKGPDGNDIGTLPLVQAKQTGTVTFTLPAGTYDFYCTVHPVEMVGKMTLQ